MASDTEETTTREERSWPEDFGSENGNYVCQCCKCELLFTGHKRRVICKVCVQVGEPGPNTQVSNGT